MRIEDAGFGTEVLEEPLRLEGEKAAVGTLPERTVKQQNARWMGGPPRLQRIWVRQLEERGINVGEISHELRRSVWVCDSHCIRAIAVSAPAVCATRKGSTWAGAIPAKVFVRARAIVTAGLAKDVEAVNQ